MAGNRLSMKMGADAADKPVQPGAARATKRADSAGAVKAAHGDKLRTRERQSTFVAGQLAMRIEEKTPGRIHCIKVSTTRYKTVTTIVFDKNKRECAPTSVDDDAYPYDSDGSGDGDEPMKGSAPVPPHLLWPAQSSNRHRR